MLQSTLRYAKDHLLIFSIEHKGTSVEVKPGCLAEAHHVDHTGFAHRPEKVGSMRLGVSLQANGDGQPQVAGAAIAQFVYDVQPGLSRPRFAKPMPRHVWSRGLRNPRQYGKPVLDGAHRGC
jgi:hypothetical protein